MRGQKEIVPELGACFQCRRCTAGCPVAAWADHPPHRIVKWACDNELDRATDTSMVWICASCLTCTARCPNNVPVAELMDVLKQRAVRNGREITEKDVLTGHRAFLGPVKRWGRLHELTMITRYKLKTGHLFQDVILGLVLFLRGKIRIFPERVGLPDTIDKEND